MTAQTTAVSWRALATLALALVLVLTGAGCAGATTRPAAARPTSSEPTRTIPVTLSNPGTAPPTNQPEPATTQPAPPTTHPAPPTTQAAPPTTHPAPVPVATAPACPENLAGSLASTAGARELITVEAAGYGTPVAAVAAWQRTGLCWRLAGGPWTGLIGANGFSDHHREGDLTTPTGLYAIGPVMYGNATDPGVQELYHQLVCGDWWDEDPASLAYNTFQHVPCGSAPPFGGDSEALWTETAQYPSFAVVEYNTDPTVPGAGSAIFVHADTGSPTTGCISIPLPDLDQLLRWIDPASAPVIAMGPASEIRGF